MMEVIAKLKDAPISAQKCRLVADLIRGMNISKAIDVLRFTTKKAATLVLKLLESAVANAENNKGIDVGDLKVGTIYVNEAASFKRMHPRAKGRGNRIVKRNCHITIKVTDEE